jgi:hypothetical protein
MNQYQYKPYEPQRLPPERGNQSSPKANLAKIVVISTSLLVVGALFCCGIGATILYVGFNYMTTEVQALLADVPEIQAHIGEINSTTHDINGSFADPDDDTFVYELEGTKGRGRVFLKHVTDDAGNERLISGTLILDDGITMPLTIAPAGN